MDVNEKEKINFFTLKIRKSEKLDEKCNKKKKKTEQEGTKNQQCKFAFNVKRRTIKVKENGMRNTKVLLFWFN